MIEIIPNWHPLFVHFTLALLSLSVVLSLLARLPLPAGLRAEWRVVARWTLWLGALFAIATAITGWLAYNSVDHDDVSHAVMTTHRNWALVTATFFVLLALWSLWNRRWAGREPSEGAVGTVFLVALAAGGVLLATTAWYGAELVYRHGLGVMSMPNKSGGEAGHETSPRATRSPAKPTTHDHSTHEH